MSWDGWGELGIGYTGRFPRKRLVWYSQCDPRTRHIRNIQSAYQKGRSWASLSRTTSPDAVVGMYIF